MFWKIFSAIILGVRNFRVFEILEHLPYSEFTVHMQNQLKAGSFVGTKVGLSHAVHFFLKCTCYAMNGFEMTLLA